MARTPWTNTPSESESQLWDSIAEGVAASLAVDALTRDRADQQADAELKLLKESGLASLLIPTEFGGPGGHWSTALRAVRILARADSSIAQLLAYSYITQSGIVFIGDPERWRHWFQRRRPALGCGVIRSIRSIPRFPWLHANRAMCSTAVSDTRLVPPPAT